MDFKKMVYDLEEGQSLPIEIISKFIDIHKKNTLPLLKRREDYYLGNHDILKRKMSGIKKPNNKVITNFCSLISDTYTGYIMGNPVTYSSNNKKYLSILKEIFDKSDEQDENIELARKQSVKGVGYELLYQDQEANTRFIKLDTDSVIMVYDSTVLAETSAAIRYYDIANYLDDKDIKTIVEVYTKDTIFYYEMVEDDLTYIKEENHYFRQVPIIEVINNEYRLNDFDRILELQNDYNLRYSDNSNELEYFRDCILKVWGFNELDDVEQMSEKRILLFDDKDKDDAEFMTKQINDQATQNHLQMCKDNIHLVSYVPDMSKEIASNVSGTAMKTRVFNIEQWVSAKERKFKKALQRRIQLITNILNIKGNNFDWREIEINFNRNIPVNMVEFADSAIKLKGIVSDRTLLKHLSDYVEIEDVDKEIDLMTKEKSLYNYDDSIPEGDTINE